MTLGMTFARRQFLQGVAASSMAVVGRALAQSPAVSQAAIGPYQADTLPAGIRSRLLDNVNGIRVHVLEAGFETRNRPAILLVHGFPELAYSWRKVMPLLAAAGYHVIAPDLRGYGRTGGTEVAFDDDLSPFRTFNRVTDMVGLVSAFGYRSLAGVVGHDVGSGIAGWCGVVRPDIFRSVVMMSAPFGGPPALPFGTADAAGPRPAPAADTIYDDLARLNPPRKHYQRYYSTREANDNMWRAPQGVHAFMRAYYHMKSADWKANVPPPQGAYRGRVGEAASLLRHGSRQGHGRDRRAGDAVRRARLRPTLAARRGAARVSAPSTASRDSRAAAVVPRRSSRPDQRRPRALRGPDYRSAIDVHRRQE